MPCTDAGQVGPGDVELAAGLQAGPQEEGREALAPEVGERASGDAHGAVEAQLDAQRQDRVDLGLDQLARQPVERHAQGQHAARHGAGLEDRHLVPGPGQVVGHREAGHPDPDHGDPLGVRRPSGGSMRVSA